MYFFRKSVLSCAVVLVLTVPVPASADSTTEFSLGYDYSSGDYGQNVTTEIEVLPASLAVSEGPWRVEITVPYIRVSGNGSVVPGAGSPMVLDSFKAGRFGGSGGGSVSSSKSTTTHGGLGDIAVSAGYALMPADGSFYEISGKLKFGTADENEGLGTGENDFALQLDGVVGAGTVSPYFTLGYLVTGDSGAVSFRDVPYGSVGLMFHLGKNATVGTGYDYRASTVRGSDDQQQLDAFLDWKLAPSLSASVSALAGFTDSSPDYGASARLTSRF